MSNFTQTLDLIQIMCRQNNYPVVRLDGTTGMTKRQKLVKQFNDPTENCFVFLLSSKAGGRGLHSFPFPLNFQAYFPSSLNLSS